MNCLWRFFDYEIWKIWVYMYEFVIYYTTEVTKKNGKFDFKLLLSKFLITYFKIKKRAIKKTFVFKRK